MVKSNDDSYDGTGIRPKAVEDFMLKLAERRESQKNHFIIYGVITGIVCLLLLKDTIFYWLLQLTLSSNFFEWAGALIVLLFFFAPMAVLYFFLQSVVRGIGGSVEDIEHAFRVADKKAHHFRAERRG